MTTDVENSTRSIARQSETGQRLTGSQFDEAWQVTGIIHREIEKSGSFISKLTDYAHAFARDERFGAARGEMILRDVYKARFGETMNQTREALIDHEANAREANPSRALHHADAALMDIKTSPGTPFWQAFDHASLTFAREEEVSQDSAKRLITDAFKAEYGQDFYKMGKESEKPFDGPETKRDRDRGRSEAKVGRSTQSRSGPTR